MTNINCSVDCCHESNGKCTLNHISVSSNFAGTGVDCAYYEPKRCNYENYYHDEKGCTKV